LTKSTPSNNFALRSKPGSKQRDRTPLRKSKNICIERNESIIYGYARVSTAQDERSQVRQLKAAGCEEVFREKITGTTADRPQLAKLMKVLAPDDIVITPAVEKLSSVTTDLLVIARDMQRAGAGIRSLAEPFFDTTSDFAGIIFAILGVAAKLERRRILERTARGRADAKANRVKFGRKPLLTPHQLGGSVPEQSRHKCASSELRSRRTASSAESVRGTPCDKAWRPGPTGRLQCL
jgi:DNA invertase Pin-like site-specific DNA recombinase